MIVMVCVSVIATVLMIHLSAISQPVPPWVNTLFLRIIPRLIFLSVGPGANRITTRGLHSNHEEECVKSDDVDAIQNGTIHENGRANHLSSNLVTCKELQDIASALNSLKTLDQDISSTLSYLKANIERKNAHRLEHAQWRRVAINVDRLLLYTFSSFTVACNIYFTVHIVLGSDEDYDKELAEFEAEMVY